MQGISKYARDIIEDRWPEGEPVIAKDAGVSREYANFLI